MRFEIEDFERLFQDNYDSLCRYAYDFLGDKEAAEDIVSDVFATVWDRQDRIDNSRNVKSYIYVTVRNRCLTYISQQPPTTDIDRKAYEMGDLDPEIREEEDRLIAEINMVIDRLPSKTRQVLDECIYKGCSYKEAAENLEISVAGVKKQIVKAYAVIREHFGVKKR